MKISYNFLQSYIVEKLPSIKEIEDALIFHAFEVEDIETTASGDTVFEVKVLPDRAHDCLSHRGMARELAGLMGLTLVATPYKQYEPTETTLTIAATTSNLRRYSGRIIRGVSIGESPAWLKDHLASLGAKSINNVVDVTNYILYGLGQPTHVFDAKKVAGGITIRQASESESINLLGKEYIDGLEKKRNIVLSPYDMVIADDKSILALAGVKGGESAEVTAETTDIILEVANFNAAAVRKTARTYNLLTDAAKRFENDLSSELATEAMQALTDTIVELAGGTPEDIVEYYPNKEEQVTVSVAHTKIEKYLGTTLSETEVVNVFDRYQYQYTVADGVYSVVVPFARIDIRRDVDLIEEVGRVIGYDRIVPMVPRLEFTPKVNEIFYRILYAKNKLMNEGYSEAMTYTFTKKGALEVARGAKGKEALRTNLTDGLKTAYELNKVHAALLGVTEVKLFEIGTVFPTADEEIIHIAIADKKGIVEMTLAEYTKDAAITDSYTDVLPAAASGSFDAFKQWSVYPFMVRDIALWVPESITESEIQSIINQHKGDLVVRGPELFDTFTKDGRTSYAFRLVFQSFEKTLSDADVQPFTDAIYNALKAIPNAEIR